MDIGKLEKLTLELEKKVEYVDVSATQISTNSIVMKDGNIQEIKSGIESGIRVRVIKNGMWKIGFFRGTDDIDYMYKRMVKVVGSGSVALAKCDPIVGNFKSPMKINPSDVPIDEKKEMVVEVEKAANIKKVVSTAVNYIDVNVKNVFLSSEGANASKNESKVALFINAVASDGKTLQFSSDRIGNVGGFEIIKQADLEKLGRKVGKNAVELLSAESPPSGRFTIVTDCELTGVFIHEAVGHASEADIVLKNDSILKNKIGKKIGSELVTIIDDPTTNGFGYYVYDSEGVKASPTTIMKNGILKSFINSRETAYQLNMNPTGNARAAFGHEPLVRMSNTYLKPRDQSFDELIEDVKEGVYLKGSRGGQVDTTRGTFQFNAERSFKIENGRITTPLRDVSMSGNILEVLKNVDAVGSDFKINAGFCGKYGQTVAVGDGGPHIRIKNVLIGGKNVI